MSVSRASLTTDGPMAPARRYRWLAAAIVLLGFALRCFRLGSTDVWVDEAASFYDAVRSDWLWQAFHDDVPPLYHLLIDAWVACFGGSPAVLRMPSALAGMAFVAATIWAGRELVDWPSALWAGFWAAISPLHVWYSQEARSYALLMLFLSVAVAATWRAFRVDSPGAWIVYSIALCGGFLSQLFAPLGLAVVSIAALRAAPDAGRRRRWLLAVLPGAALAALWVGACLVPTLAHVEFPGSWVREAWQATPPLAAIPKTLAVFAIGSWAGLGPLTMKKFAPEFPLALRVAGLGGAAILALAALATRGRRRALVVAGLLVPLVVLWLVSFVKPVYVVGRYDLIAFPFFPLLLGLGAARLARAGTRARALAAMAVLALVVADAARLAVYYGASERDDPERLATALLSRVENGDLVIFTELGGVLLLYRFSRLGYRCDAGSCTHPGSDRRFAWRMFPLETEESAATYRPEHVLTTPGAAERQVSEILRGGAGRTVHVVFNTFARSGDQLIVPPVEALLARALRSEGFQRVGGDPDSGIVSLRR